MNLWVIFLTGLTTGGLSCLAVQGGLLTSVIANQKEKELDNSNLLPVILFLGTKLIAHIILGFFLGWLGSQFTLTVTARLIFQGLAALFMVGTALNLLNVHPIFRYLVFQPPRFIRKVMKNTTQSETIFTPAILGLITIFIPCGVTQAMEVLAISSGQPFTGALIMGIFVLGTSPLFAAIGIATAKLSQKFRDKFLKITAVALMVLAISSINGILVVLDSPLSFTAVTRSVSYYFSDERLSQLATSKKSSVAIKNGVQIVTIEARSNGYVPNKITVKAGIPVELTVFTKNSFSCASSFVFKPFGITFDLGPNDTMTTTFTPTKPGKYQFSCSMGMYHGVMEVI